MESEQTQNISYDNVPMFKPWNINVLISHQRF